MSDIGHREDTPNGALQAETGGLHLISKLIVNDKGIDSEALDAISHWAPVIGDTLSTEEAFRTQYGRLGEAEELITPGTDSATALADLFKQIVYNWHSLTG